jgi:hypothetical protein
MSKLKALLIKIDRVSKSNLHWQTLSLECESIRDEETCLIIIYSRQIDRALVAHQVEVLRKLANIPASHMPEELQDVQVSML